jgi:outer membrane protein
MLKHKTVICMLAVISSCLHPPKGRGIELTLEDCLELGVERSVEMQNAAREKLIAETRIGQARAQALPSLDGFANYTRRDEVASIPEADISFGRLDNYSAGLDARQLLYSGGSVAAALDAARDFRDMTVHGYDQTRNAIRREVAVAFHEILYSAERVAVTRQSVEQLEGFVAEARSKFEQGVISEFDLLSAEVKLANERPKLVSDQNALEIKRAAFAKLLRLEDQNFELIGSLDCVLREYELGKLTETGLRERPDLRAAAAQVRLRAADVEIEQGRRLPEISARASYRGENPDQQSFSAADDWGWHWDAGLDISWSLLDGGLRRARLMEKSLRREQVEADSRDLELEVALEIRQAYLTLQNARKVVESSLKTVELAQKAFAIAETRYQQGLSTYLEFADSNLALSQARLNRAQSQTRYLQALADLRFACGSEELPAR